MLSQKNLRLFNKNTRFRKRHRTILIDGNTLVIKQHKRVELSVLAHQVPPLTGEISCFTNQCRIVLRPYNCIRMGAVSGGSMGFRDVLGERISIGRRRRGEAGYQCTSVAVDSVQEQCVLLASKMSIETLTHCAPSPSSSPSRLIWIRPCLLSC